jgi:hypothetical protein
MFNGFLNWTVNCKYFTAESEDAIFSGSAGFFLGKFLGLMAV